MNDKLVEENRDSSKCRCISQRSLADTSTTLSFEKGFFFWLWVTEAFRLEKTSKVTPNLWLIITLSVGKAGQNPWKCVHFLTPWRTGWICRIQHYQAFFIAPSKFESPVPQTRNYSTLYSFFSLRAAKWLRVVQCGFCEVQKYDAIRSH